MCPTVGRPLGLLGYQLRRAPLQVLDHRGAPRLAAAAGGADVLDRAAISNRRSNIAVVAGRVTPLARVADGGGAVAALLLAEGLGFLLLAAERARLYSTEQLVACTSGVTPGLRLRVRLRVRRNGADLAERARLEGLLPLR
eukprot:scaffold37729_cov65-Phaeocystis_antarctica.AAC.3